MQDLVVRWAAFVAGFALSALLTGRPVLERALIGAVVGLVVVLFMAWRRRRRGPTGSEPVADGA